MRKAKKSTELFSVVCIKHLKELFVTGQNLVPKSQSQSETSPRSGTGETEAVRPTFTAAHIWVVSGWRTPDLTLSDRHGAPTSPFRLLGAFGPYVEHAPVKIGRLFFVMFVQFLKCKSVSILRLSYVYIVILYRDYLCRENLLFTIISSEKFWSQNSVQYLDCRFDISVIFFERLITAVCFFLYLFYV